jgi:hypothetical protein
MDIQPTTQQPISDDQELAKVLAGVTQQADEVASAPVASDTTVPVADTPEPEVEEPVAPVVPAPEPVMETPAVAPTVPAVGGNLDSIKNEALGELRPLVDKLNVSAEEKFDTYLLLIRSTDDQSLVAPAHEAARSITDEARRAQALLDIIKEIDYLSNPQHTA